MSADRPPPVLAIETATARAVIAIGGPGGEVLAADEWDAGHRHAEELVCRIAALMERLGLGRPAPGVLAGVIVGTGPGGYTGLRVGLATGLGIARAADVPLVGVPTGTALEAAARAAGVIPPGASASVLLPAGSSGRYVVRGGRAVLQIAGSGEDPGPAGWTLAVDLVGRAPDDAVARGSVALDGLAAALLALGARRLEAGADDRLVLAPEYVTLPRGVPHAVGEVTWSPVRR